MEHFTATEAAEILGCHKSTISRIATRREEAGEPIGSRHARTWLFSKADVELLRPLVGKVGNPNFGANEDLYAEQRRASRAKPAARKKAGRKPKKKD